MVTHWESSRRPLYVKTIWKDGQHHVILDKTKESSIATSQFKKTKESSSKQSTNRSVKSAITGVNLKVSSVRVLLSGVNGFKNVQRTQRSARIKEQCNDKPQIWIKPSIIRPVTGKNLNKEVTFNTIRGTKALNLYKSNTVDSDYLDIGKTSEQTPKFVPDNALSEKVMIWLDLATQSGYLDREVKEEKAVRVQAYEIKEKPTSKNYGGKKNFQPPIVQEETVDSSILKSDSQKEDSEKTEIVVYSNEEAEILEEDFYHVLSPTIDEEEGSCAGAARENEKKKRVNTAKRQLHIFMPNLPKKTSDCDSSILSSQISLN